MLELATRLGATHLVTGHYARVLDGPVPLLRMARHTLKDQSYALAGLDPSSLARLRFPLGDITKDEVREIAEREGLSVAHKPDSQDLCFLAGTDLPRFIARHGDLAPAPGNILDADGARLGTHRGAHAYTVGQRHGLGLRGGPEPLFVLGTDPLVNTVTVGPRAGADDRHRHRARRGQARQLRSGGRRRARALPRARAPCRLAADPGPGRHEWASRCSWTSRSLARRRGRSRASTKAM